MECDWDENLENEELIFYSFITDVISSLQKCAN